MEENENKIILDLCGGTGSWSKPYKDAGYNVIVITLPDFDLLKTRLVNGGANFVGDDLSVFVPLADVHAILCAPPCTHFAGSGAQYWKQKDKDGRTEKALEIIDMCLDIVGHFSPKVWALENPVGRLPKLRGDRLGEVRLKFNPCDYGDAWTKKTYVWGQFNLPEKNPVKLTEKQKQECRINNRKLGDIPADYKKDPEMTATQIKRSITPQGFAEAFYEVNK
jgi:site-specific DNA-cytosine methylase